MTNRIEHNDEIIIKLIRSNRRVILNGKQIKFSESLKYADYKVDKFGWGDFKHKKEAYQLAATILGKTYTMEEKKYYRTFAEKYLLTLPKNDVILKFKKDQLISSLLESSCA